MNKLVIMKKAAGVQTNGEKGSKQ
ncbi:hypothetical protein iLP1308_33 [Lactobacillus phage iLp1308]|uniref:Uncharacterized protein n=1 Tax=Lactobacillus phage iLp1308 TaxID=1739611 RepID=A0A0P0I3I0_9CAUD|nr:hypothetical protein iLP1308_33 [Lactobacillus phage iLp1308]ALJ97925.1 hypothetical protein iLP1308_33 [Lactobacillus phage iLp1308]